ncbi:MAG: hypothetical protein OEY36_08755 [Gammaproteobacteria bacterium]|nr:hypothetical protein [Gammaproteobacteria bacterium]
MNFLKKVLFILIFSGSMMLLNGCSDPVSTTSCDGSLSCPNYSTNINTCCSNNSCWYEANGNTFTCNSQYDCYSAAQGVTSYCNAADTDGLATDLSLEKAKNVKLNMDLDAVYKSILE